jgi:hypothetical protein
MTLLDSLREEDPDVVRVVISDNSSDDFRYTELLPRLLDHHPLEIVLVRLKSLVSAAENFKSLLSSVLTPYACFCGDDDAWSPGGVTLAVKWMIEHNVDMTYPAVWHTHFRDDPRYISQSSDHLFPLSDRPEERVLSFLSYNNDPFFYGIYSSPLLIKVLSEWRRSWSFLPANHIWNTSYLGMVSVLLHSQNPCWFLGTTHSQGVPRPVNVQGFSRLLILARRASRMPLNNVYYLIRRIQILARCFVLVKPFCRGTVVYWLFCQRAIAITLLRLPVVCLGRRLFGRFRLKWAG